MLFDMDQSHSHIYMYHIKNNNENKVKSVGIPPMSLTDVAWFQLQICVLGRDNEETISASLLNLTFSSLLSFISFPNWATNGASGQQEVAAADVALFCCPFVLSKWPAWRGPIGQDQGRGGWGSRAVAACMYWWGGNNVLLAVLAWLGSGEWIWDSKGGYFFANFLFFVNIPCRVISVIHTNTYIRCQGRKFPPVVANYSISFPIIDDSHCSVVLHYLEFQIPKWILGSLLIDLRV